jgi:hypothetical protein
VRIALIGSAPSSVNLAPFKDKSYDKFLNGKPAPLYPPSEFINDDWEIWACSPGAYGQLHRCNRFFEVHRWEPGQSWFSPEYVGFLKDFRGPVYTGRPVPDIKNHVVYPIERVESELSSYFLTSSLSLMCALAILEIEDYRKANPDHDHKQDVIAFFGVDMAAHEEYGYQRAGCQHFILEAMDRGIGIYVPPESDLLRPMPVYGLCEWDHIYIKLTARARELNMRISRAQQQIQSGSQELQFLQGAQDDLNYTSNTWTSKYEMPAGQVIRKVEPKKEGPLP